jgi:single-stranded DNA-specific DHH superfamily exonuclease
MLDKAAEFIKNCDPKETTIVYHGGCGDGLAAAAIMLKAFQRVHGEMPKAKFASPGNVHKVSLYSKYIIFDDLAADQEKDYMLQVARNSKVLILDHHKIANDLNEEGILHVNPELFTKLPGVRYPGAKLTFDVCSLIADVKDMDWLAVVGTIHDGGGEFWKPFIDKTFAKYPELGKPVYGYEGKLAKLTSILTAGQDLKRGNEVVLKILIEAERPSDILDATIPEVNDLLELRKAREKEVQHYLDNWEKLADIDRSLGLVFYDIDFKYKVSSALSTAISMKYPDFIFVVMNKENSSVLKLNFRQTKEKIDCSWLAGASTAEFGGQGGGHRVAAGGRIHPKYKEKFKEKVRELVKQRLRK